MNKNEKKLIRLYEILTSSEREMLMSYAEFLVERSDGPSNDNHKIEEPVEIIRPPEETIVAAVKRLSASFPMLDKSQLLSDVSEKVTQHVIFGREITEVIDELEIFFQKNYQQYKIDKEAVNKTLITGDNE